VRYPWEKHMSAVLLALIVFWLDLEAGASTTCNPGLLGVMAWGGHREGAQQSGDHKCKSGSDEGLLDPQITFSSLSKCGLYCPLRIKCDAPNESPVEAKSVVQAQSSPSKLAYSLLWLLYLSCDEICIWMFYIKLHWWFSL
jgi:hypothetical protein